MDKITVLPLQEVKIGIASPQGLQLLQVSASNFVKIDMIPGQMIIVQRTNQVNGTVSVQEFFAGGPVFWEYTVKKDEPVAQD